MTGKQIRDSRLEPHHMTVTAKCVPSGSSGFLENPSQYKASPKCPWVKAQGLKLSGLGV